MNVTEVGEIGADPCKFFLKMTVYHGWTQNKIQVDIVGG